MPKFRKGHYFFPHKRNLYKHAYRDTTTPPPKLCSNLPPPPRHLKIRLVRPSLTFLGHHTLLIWQMYFLALRNARCFSALHTDVLVFVAWIILAVRVIICYQVYKVFFADSRSLDGISRYRSVNYGWNGHWFFSIEHRWSCDQSR